MESEDLHNLIDYMVIRIVPKEKELKETFRGFGCQTYMERARRIIQEKATADYLDLFYHNQTMTLTALGTIKKLRTLATLEKAYPGYVKLCMVVDSSKWCNNWRSEVVDVVCKQVLGKYYNVNLWDKTMKSFQKTLLMCPDEEDTYYWYGQDGGIEGLNQYTWSMVYIEVLKTCLQKYEDMFPMHILCKGDDIRIFFMIPPSYLETTTIDEIRSQLLETIISGCKGFGHTINFEESYCSGKYFAFSKQAFCEGIELPQLFRKIQKSHGTSNSFVTSMDEQIGSCFSNCHSAARVSHSAVTPMLVAHFWTYYLFLLNPKYERLTIKEWVSLTLIPGLMGGFPIVYLPNFFTASECDLLVPFLDLVNFCQSRFPDVAECMVRFLHVQELQKAGFKGLLTDPYSLPIQKPSQPSTILRKEMTDILPKLCKNEDIHAIIQLIKKGVNEKIEDFMEACNVYNGRVFAATYSCSPQGYLDSLVRQFESGRSVCEAIISAVGTGQARRILRKVIKAERAIHDWRIKQLQGKNRYTRVLTEFRSPCSAKWAQSIRDTMWGKPVECVTMPTIKHLVTIIDADDIGINDWCVSNHFLYHYRPPNKFLDSRRLPGYASGVFEPFLGNITRTNMRSSSIKLEIKDEYLKNVQTLLDLVSWVNVECQDNDGTLISSNYVELLKYIIRLYLDADPDSMMVFKSERKSGTISHHVRAPKYKVSIMPNILSNNYQTIKGFSNTHNTFRISPDHYHFNHLLCYCDVVSTVTLSTGVSNDFVATDQDYWAVTTDCQHCVSPLRETLLISDLTILRDLPQAHISAIKLCKSSEDYILGALDIEGPRIQRNVGCISEIPLNIVEYCILQEHCDESFSRHLRLLEHEGKHTFALGQSDKISNLITHTDAVRVSYKELKSISTQSYCSYLSVLVGHYISTSTDEITLFGVSMWLSNTRSHNLPWYGVLRTLQDIGRLHQLLLLLAKMCGLPVNQHHLTLEGSVAYVGQACYRIYRRGLAVVPPVVVFSAYHLTEWGSKIKTQYRYCKYRFQKLVLAPGLKRGLASSDANVITAYCEHILYIYGLRVPEDDELNALLCDMRLHTTQDLKWWDKKYFDPDVMEALLEDADNLPRPIKKVLIKKPEFEYERLLIKLQHDANTSYNALERAFTPPPLTVAYTTFPACVSRVREEPMVNIVPLSRSLYIDHDPSKDVAYGETNDTYVKWNFIIAGRKTNPKHFIGSSMKAMTINLNNNLPLVSIPLYNPCYHMSKACNKLLDLICYLGIRFPDYSRGYALADGCGGFCATIATLIKKGTLVFNTLKENPDVEVFATAAHPICEKKSIRLEYGNLNSGYDDLCNKMTILHLSTLLSTAHILTCDAQSSHQTDEQRIQLVKNVILLYLNKRTHEGVIILKLYINEERPLSMACATLSYYCRQTTLIKPRSSGLNSEIYMVARGTRRKYIHNFAEDGLMYLDIKRYETIRHSILKLREMIFNLLESKPREIDLMHVVYPRSIMKLFDPAFSAILLSLLGTDIDRSLLKRALETHSEQNSFLARLYDSLKEVGRSTLKDLMVIKHEGHSYNPDSRRSRQKQFNHFLVAEAVCYVLARYRKREALITEQELRRYYKQLLERYAPLRLQLLPVNSHHFRKDFSKNNFPLHTYEAFLDGVNIGLSTCGYFNT